MYKAKIEFLWYSKGDTIKDKDHNHCEKWEKENLVELTGEVKQEVVKPVTKKVTKPSKKKNIFDLNGDGKVDKKDFGLAGRVLARSRRKKK